MQKPKRFITHSPNHVHVTLAYRSPNPDYIPSESPAFLCGPVPAIGYQRYIIRIIYVILISSIW